MRQSIAQRAIYLFSLLVPGLFAGRLLSELWHPGLAAAALLTLLCAAIAAGLLHRRSAGKILWPALPLLAYIFYPVARPAYAVAVAAIALLATLMLYGLPKLRPITLPARLQALLVFLLGLVLYTVTLAPGLLAADNGEFQLVAARLGVAHPPGFALYTLLAHLATRLPLGPDAAYRANLFSAFTAAATLALLFLSALRLTHSRRAALVAVLTLATATTYWSQATTANVRMLTAFFAALALYLLLCYAEQRAAPPPAEGYAPSPNLLLFLFALALSLGITHHASLAFMASVFILALLWLDPGLLRRPRRWVAPLAGLLLGLLPLLYFPLRGLSAAAGEAVRGATPALATLPGFLQHVLALGFRGDLFAYTTPGELWPRLQVMANVMTFQFHWLLLFGMLLGIALLLRRRRPLALALGGSFALHTLVTASYRAPQTVEYMLPAYVPAALLLAVAAAPPPGLRARLPRFLRHGSALLTASFLVIAGAQGLQRYPSFQRLSHDHTARAYAAAIMEQAPSGSVVLADWHWATPLWYLQEVNGRRPDLAIDYVFPTAEPYAQTWARRISENLAAGHPVVATRFDSAAYQPLPAPEPLAGAFLFTQAARQTLPAGFTPLTQTLGDRIELLGYRLNTQTLTPLQETTLTLAWRRLPPTTTHSPNLPISNLQSPNLPVSQSPVSSLPISQSPSLQSPVSQSPISQSPISLFTHLVNDDHSTIYAQQDIPASPAPDGITLTQLRLTPRLASPPATYRLLVGAYESDTLQPLTTPDGATRTQLQAVTLQPMAQPPITAHPLYAPSTPDNRRLIGYDWDHTLAPRTRLYLHWQTPDGYVTEAWDDPAPGAPLPQFYGPWGQLQPVGAAATPQQYIPLGAGIVWRGSTSLSAQETHPAAAITLAQQFGASRPLQQDLVVSVRLIGYAPDGASWAWWDLHDTVPALGAIPTLKWITGSHIRDPHLLTVSPEATPGQALGALLTVYDAFTQRPLPILDERITDQYPGIPLGTAQVD